VIPLVATDFEAGNLHRESFVLPHRLVTANETCIQRSVGRLKPDKLNHLRERVCSIIRHS
jgi:mRNA-degrading endonuclease toxin of MazEF toxin-antitoxin module